MGNIVFTDRGAAAKEIRQCDISRYIIRNVKANKKNVIEMGEINGFL